MDSIKFIQDLNFTPSVLVLFLQFQVDTEFYRWTSIEILKGKDEIPADRAPPFVIITLTDDPDCGKNRTQLGKFVQLPKGVKKESYGDLLESYTEVKSFCDTIEFDDNRFLKLGDIDACNLDSVCKSNFPVVVPLICQGNKIRSGDACEECSNGTIARLFECEKCPSDEITKNGVFCEKCEGADVPNADQTACIDKGRKVA